MIDMIRRRVAREPQQVEATGVHLTQLLHAMRPPAQYRRAPQAERCDQPVCGLRRTRKRSGEYFRVGYDEAFVPAHCRAREVRERYEIRGVERPARGEERPLRD